MSEPLGPRRPLPKSVYVRRRIVVGVIALAIVIILIAILWPRGGTTPHPGTTPGADSTNAASDPSGAATGASGDSCDPSKIAITANTDKAQYASGESVQVSLTLTNNSSKDCVIAAGTDQQVFTISSPSGSSTETYWTSTDCQTGATPQNVMLKAGVPVSTPAITWDRHRSIQGKCDAAEIAARPIVGSGGASFDLVVKLGSLTSDPKRFYLY